MCLLVLAVVEVNSSSRLFKYTQKKGVWKDPFVKNEQLFAYAPGEPNTARGSEKPKA